MTSPPTIDVTEDEMPLEEWLTGGDEPHPCGHVQRLDGCGGCDPGAIEFVIDDGGTGPRRFDPIEDMSLRRPR